MHYISNGSTRMQLMIDSLLKYARLSKEVTLKQFPVNRAIKESIANLSQRIHEHGAKVHVEVFHEVLGNEPQLIQLFQNLISNAIKYQREGIPPEINITEKIKDNRVIIECCR